MTELNLPATPQPHTPAARAASIRTPAYDALLARLRAETAARQFDSAQRR
jgi:hypothetical protein